MLRICAAPNCGTRTLGQFCIEHEGLESVLGDVAKETAQREGSEAYAGLFGTDDAD